MKVEHVIVSAKAGDGAPIDFTGIWKNELRSEAKLTQTGNILSGTYKSKVSADHEVTAGVITGYVDGALISFVVRWNDFQAITAWVGQIDSASRNTINTLWQMTRQVEAGDDWTSINAGADVFTKVSESL